MNIKQRGSVRLMGKVGLKPRRYACFTKEQQEAYEKLSLRQRLYVDFRGEGNSKTNSYKMAGFDGKTAGQAAYLLEQRNAVIAELVNCIQGQTKVAQLSKEDSAINQQIDALARQDGAEKMMEVIEGADGETAKRIQFYRDVMNGKVKTVRKTKKWLVCNKHNEVSKNTSENPYFSLRIRRASCISLGMIVTRLAWMAHRLVSSNSDTR